MRLFAQLYQQLDASTATGDKLAALKAYFAVAPAADAAWALYFLAGGKPRQTVPMAVLRQLACQRAGLDDWLFEACYQAAGDLAETIAQVLPAAATPSDAPLSHWVEQRLLPLRGQPPEVQAERIGAAWDELDTAGRFLLVKLIGGGFRVGVSKLLVQRALAEQAGLPPPLLAQRLMGCTEARAMPTAAGFLALLRPAGEGVLDDGQPYPFFLAQPLPGEAAALGGIDSLGNMADWLAEWKYDGIRAQLVKRAGRVWLWSRGEELITERFPEVVAAAQGLADGTVLDGELLVWPAGQPQPSPFSQLQQRTTRKTLPKKLLAETPVVLVAYDLLELAGADQRGQPQHQRRARLEQLLGGHTALRLSPLLQAADWPALAAQRAMARERGVEGLMLKHRQAAYGLGRSQAGGAWWKWKLAPLTADAVLIYAQAGHGRRAGLYTDYSFAVWSRPPADAAEAQAVVDAITRREPALPGALQLLTFAKAYSGLTDDEFVAVDRVVRANTLEKFGPVRSLKPTLVVELGFEGLNPSTRHKSGIAVRFPRMLRVRYDKPLHEADSIASLQALMAAAGAGAEAEVREHGGI